MYEKRICSIRMPTPFVSPDPFSALPFYLIGASCAGNATLGTTPASSAAVVSHLFL